MPAPRGKVEVATGKTGNRDLKVEAKNLLLVLGEYIWERQVIAPAEQWRTAVANLRELGKLSIDCALAWGRALKKEHPELATYNFACPHWRVVDAIEGRYAKGR